MEAGDGGLAGALPTITKPNVSSAGAQSVKVNGFESGLVPIAFVAETRHA